MNLFVCYPKCTTCQRAEKWLKEKGIVFETRNIKEENPTEKELREWHKKSGLPLKRFFNTSGLVYKSLGLSAKLGDMTEKEQYSLLSGDGMLVKRPILVTDHAVLVGFKQAEWENEL